MKERIYYQWLPGTENDGTVSILKNIYIDDGDVYYEFTDGNVCFEGLVADYTNDPKDLRGMAVVRISNPNNVWTFETIKNKSMDQYAGVSHNSGQTGFEVPSFNDYSKTGNFKSDEGKIKFIAPKNQVKFIPKINYKVWMSIDDQLKYGLISEDEYYENIVVEECQADTILPVVKVERMPSNVTKDNNDHHIDITDFNNSTILVSNPTDAVITVSTNENVAVKLDNINISNDKLFDDNDPVAILVNKSAKFESVISMDLKLDLPAKSLFNIASENFENGEETFINVILSHIDYETIKNTLKDALLDAYHNE